jgi:isopentenyl diphosphate isomerase/L-lactate dehydrogenase-like FMN-dependent dehydrogenase
MGQWRRNRNDEEMTAPLNFKEIRESARRRLPRGLFEYIDRGTEDENAIRNGRHAFERMRFAPRALVTGEISLKTRLFGKDYDAPIIVAPTALTGLVWYQGEVSLARAASSAGIGYCAATMAVTPVEEIALASAKPVWFQLYLWQQADLWRDLVRRAWQSGTRTLLLTVDTNVPANREFNLRNGFGVPLSLSTRNVIDVVSHPRWAAGVLGRYWVNGRGPSCGNYPAGYQASLWQGSSLPRLTHHPELSWDHVRAVRDEWKGDLVIKGILRPEDAVRCAEVGADGIVVSNHGARNFDSAPAPIEVLPSIVEAAGERLTILADSNVQRGSDIFKLIALGAKGVLAGRIFVFGTAAGGETGAANAIEVLKSELRRTMVMSGFRTLDQVKAADILTR